MNNFKRIPLIIMIWIMCLAVGTTLAMIFDNKYFLIRTLIVMPFTFLCIDLTMLVWKHKK